MRHGGQGAVRCFFFLSERARWREGGERREEEVDFFYSFLLKEISCGRGRAPFSLRGLPLFRARSSLYHPIRRFYVTFVCLVLGVFFRYWEKKIETEKS